MQPLLNTLRKMRSLVLGQHCAACQAPCIDAPVCKQCLAQSLSTRYSRQCLRCASVMGLAFSGADTSSRAQPTHDIDAANTIEYLHLCGACIRKPPAFDAAVCVGAFTDPLAQLIAQYKFNQSLVLASWFAQQLDRAVQTLSLDLITAVPLFHTRLKERGFNQSWEIAKRLQHGAPKKTLLTRVRDTPSQRTVSAVQRFANVRGAFSANESMQGLRILLVDDVVTTTATANEASKALKSAGAAHVTLACIARVSDG